MSLAASAELIADACTITSRAWTTLCCNLQLDHGCSFLQFSTKDADRPLKSASDLEELHLGSYEPRMFFVADVRSRLQVGLGILERRTALSAFRCWRLVFYVIRLFLVCGLGACEVLGLLLAA